MWLGYNKCFIQMWPGYNKCFIQMWPGRILKIIDTFSAEAEIVLVLDLHNRWF